MGGVHLEKKNYRSAAVRRTDTLCNGRYETAATLYVMHELSRYPYITMDRLEFHPHTIIILLRSSCPGAEVDFRFDLDDRDGGGDDGEAHTTARLFG